MTYVNVNDEIHLVDTVVLNLSNVGKDGKDGYDKKPLENHGLFSKHKTALSQTLPEEKQFSEKADVDVHVKLIAQLA